MSVGVFFPPLVIQYTIEETSESLFFLSIWLTGFT